VEELYFALLSPDADIPARGLALPAALLQLPSPARRAMAGPLPHPPQHPGAQQAGQAGQGGQHPPLPLARLSIQWPGEAKLDLGGLTALTRLTRLSFPDGTRLRISSPRWWCQQQQHSGSSGSTQLGSRLPALARFEAGDGAFIHDYPTTASPGSASSSCGWLPPTLTALVLSGVGLVQLPEVLQKLTRLTW